MARIKFWPLAAIVLHASGMFWCPNALGTTLLDGPVVLNVESHLGNGNSPDITLTSSGDIYVAILPPLGVFNELMMDAGGDLTIGAALDVIGDVIILSQNGDVALSDSLKSGGTIQNTAKNSVYGNGVLTSNALGISAGTGIGSSQDNPFLLSGVNVVAANSGTGAVHLRRTGGDLEVGTVGSIVGVSTTDQAISIDITAGNLTITDQVNAGLGVNAEVILKASGSLTGAGVVTGNALSISTGTGIESSQVDPFLLNDINTVAVDGDTGGVHLRRTLDGDLTVGSVGGLIGVTTGSIDAKTGSLSVTEQVSGGDVTLVSTIGSIVPSDATTTIAAPAPAPGFDSFWSHSDAPNVTITDLDPIHVTGNVWLLLRQSVNQLSVTADGQIRVVADIPEPGTLLMAAAGLVMVAFKLRC